MTPLHQIKKLAGSLVFNQFLYPRDSFISESTIANSDETHKLLEYSLGDSQQKIQFALDWCLNNPGEVLDLANHSGKLGLALVENGITTSSLENCPQRITALRKARKLLSTENQSIFKIYPLDLSKFEIDETYSTVFASPQVLEQSESELQILGILRNILAHLKPEGSFFVEAHNLDFLENQWHFREGNWGYLSDSILPLKARVWERTTPGSKESQTVFEYAVSKNLNEFEIHRSTLHLFNQDQWMKLFEVAGFVVEDCFGNWNRTAVNSQLPKLIFHLKAR